MTRADLLILRLLCFTLAFTALLAPSLGQATRPATTRAAATRLMLTREAKERMQYLLRDLSATTSELGRARRLSIAPAVGTYVPRGTVTPEQKREAIEYAEMRIKKIQDELLLLRQGRWTPLDTVPAVPAPPAPFRGDLAAGTIGTFERPVSVRQVVDTRNMLVDAPVGRDATELIGKRAVPVIRYADVLLWVTGIRTENIVDDQRMALLGAFKVRGAKQYETVIGGSKTVFVIEPHTQEASSQPAQPAALLKRSADR